MYIIGVSKNDKYSEDWANNSAALSECLCHWFEKSKRELPWRAGDTTPWGIFISEIMLQQTTVPTALPYWHRFMDRFPTPQSMATTSEDEILAMWSGLGYYRRARNLRKAAQLMCESFGGDVPCTFEDILALPGVGRYTAGAVASFAFNQPVPIVEANTARALARIGAITNISNDSELWEFAKALLPKDNPRLHNYAIMELGAIVCKPTEPLCSQCPIAQFCKAKAQNLVASIPPPKKAVEKLAIHYLAVAIQNGDKWLLRRIPTNEWHAGMMEFPKVEMNVTGMKSTKKNASQSKALKQLSEQLHMDCCRKAVYRKTVKYVVTNHSITLEVWMAQTDTQSIRMNREQEGLFWIATDELDKYPYGSAMRRIILTIIKEAKENR